MLQKLGEWWQGRTLVKKLEQHPVHGPVLVNLRTVINDKSQGIGKYWSDAGKQGLVSKVLTDLDAQLSQPDPVQRVRMRLIEFMMLAASFQVLVLQPPSKVDGISGELKPAIPELAKVDKDLEAFFYGLDDPVHGFDEMWDAVLGRYWVLNLFMNSFNTARIMLGDWHTDRAKDWFKPCYASFCIWHENQYRGKLGLPPVISGRDPDLRAIMHSTWLQRAEEGHRELRLAWERTWEEAFEEQSPFAGEVVDVT